MEKNKIDKIKHKRLLEKTMLEYESIQKDLVKTLSDKLKLSEKFVRTSQF